MTHRKRGFKTHPSVELPERNITKKYVLNPNFVRLCTVTTKSVLMNHTLDLAYATEIFISISGTFCVFTATQKIFSFKKYKHNYNQGN